MTIILDLLASVERGPTPEQLAAAPRVDGWWVIESYGFLRAKGDLSGHPDITDPFVTTSPLIGFDVEAGWMRTRSRFYRLGQPLVLEGFTLVDAVPLDLAQQFLAKMRAGLLAEEEQCGLVH